MNRSTPFFLFCIGLSLSLSVPVAAAPADTNAKEIRRFALIVGANDGGRDRLPLRYAVTDANAFSRVMTEIGGVTLRDRLVLSDSRRESLEIAFDRMARQMRAAQQSGYRVEFVFYYSGHSDERGLMLGNRMLTYRDLRRHIDELPARVRIGILDSCASGALVRIKGGVRTAPFLVDASTEVHGYALLTSASADEYAQESQRIGASFFTHNLISGLRGAADVNGDGRVTLSESYAYAFDETLRQTESTRGGPQHPNYDFQLSGTGDLVLTDLRATDATLAFADAMEGRLFIRDNGGRLIAEILKQAGRPLTLALPPGVYEITLDHRDGVRRGQVRVIRGRVTRVDPNALPVAQRVDTSFRGEQRQDLPVHRTTAATLVPGLSTNRTPHAQNRLAVNFIGEGHSLRGVEFGLLANRRYDHVRGVQVAFGMNRTSTLHGAQLGGYNLVRGEMNGAQVGILNVARTADRGAQIGLINLVHNGLLAMGAWTSDTALLNIGVKMGGRHTYSLLGFSVRPDDPEYSFIAPLWGFGGRLERPGLPVFWELDLVLHWPVEFRRLPLDEDSAPREILSQLRLVMGIRLWDRVSFYAGPLLNTFVSDNDGRTVALLPVLHRKQVGSVHVEISPGFLAGFQIEPRIGRFNTWRQSNP